MGENGNFTDDEEEILRMNRPAGKRFKEAVLLHSSSDEMSDSDMAELVADINDVQQSHKKYCAIAMLKENKEYNIIKLEEKDSKFRTPDNETVKCIMVEGVNFYTYLPRQYSIKYTGKLIKNLNNKISNNKIKYHFVITSKQNNIINLKFKIEKL